MEKPKQEDFETETIYIVALEKYIEYIELSKLPIECIVQSEFFKRNFGKRNIKTNKQGIEFYEKSIAEQDAINKAHEKPKEIIKLTKANKFLKKHHPNFNSDIWQTVTRVDVLFMLNQYRKILKSEINKNNNK